MKKFNFIFIAFAFIFVACGGGGGGGDTGPSAPNTSIDDNSMGISSEGVTNQKIATFNYSTSSTEAVGFQCSLNGAAWQSCQGGTETYSNLEDAEYTFQVKAYLLDDNQKEDKTPASFTWTVDTTGPTVNLETVPNDPTNATNGQISFSHDGVRASCNLDGVVTDPCISPFTYGSPEALTEGEHAFSVTSFDDLENDSSESHEWTIDTTGPSITHKTRDPDSAEIVFEDQITFEFGNDSEDGDSNDIVMAYHQMFISKEDGSVVSVEGSWQEAAFGAQFYNAFYLSLPVLESSLDEYFIQYKVVDSLGNETIDGDDADERDYFAVIEHQPLELHFKANPPSDIEEGDFSNEVTGLKIYFEEINHPEKVAFECNLNNSSWFDCNDEDADGHYWLSSGLTEGSQNLIVKAHHIEIAEIADVEKTLSWTVDTVKPEVSVDSGPNDPTNETTVTFTYSSNEDTLPAGEFECKLSGGINVDWESCPGTGWQYSGLNQEGAYVFEVRATDLAGNISDPDSYSFTIDTTNPSTTINSGPPSLSGSNEATFEFSSNETGSIFECKLDDGAWEASCSSPKNYSDLSGGEHTFYVKSQDTAGNIGNPAEYIWTIDLSIPDTTITSGPSGITNVNSANFTFVNPEGDSFFECMLSPDETVYTSCNGVNGSGSKTYIDLTEGTKTFYVRALNDVGTADPTPAEREWTIDQTPPETNITIEPAIYTNEDTVAWHFSADEEAPFFQCKFASASTWNFCTSPKEYELLAEGTHTFMVRAWDTANNIDSTPAESTTNVDRAAPTTTITSSPSDPSNETDGTFEVDVQDQPWETLPGLTSVFYCISNDGTCTGEEMTDQGDGSYSADYSSLPEGEWTFKAWSVDLAGNIEEQGANAEHVWNIDTTGAQTEITNGPDDPTNATIPVFEFKESSDDPEATFECRLLPIIADWTSCTSPKVYSGLTDDEYTFEVKAFDSLGNEDISPATWTWTIDTVSPTTQIDSTPLDPTTSTEATFTFSSPSDTEATFECKLDDGEWEACESGLTYIELTDGNHTFSTRAQDLAGNIDPTPSEYSWMIDITGPVTSITSAPMDPTNSIDAVFEWSTDESSTSECKLDEEEWEACESPKTYLNLGQNTNHTFEVRSTDDLGNLGAADVWTWNIDTINPTTVILTGPSDPSNNISPTFTYESPENPTATFQCELDGGDLTQCDGGSITFNDLLEGSHVFKVYATDEAGNTDTAGDSWSWNIDTTPSETYIDSGPANPTSLTSASFVYRDDESTDYFMCKIDDSQWEQCDGGAKDYLDLLEGLHTFMVKSIDEAGNEDLTPASWNWTIDQTEPETTITDGPPDPTPDPTASFIFESNEPNSTFECKLDLNEWEICMSPQDYAGLAEGAHTFEVRAIDEAGNMDQTPASWNWLIDPNILPPDTFIDSSPPLKTFTTTADFTFSSDDLEATFECSLNQDVWETCTSPKNYSSDLPYGENNFRVRASNSGGLTDSSPASYDWIIITDSFSNLLSGPNMEGSFFNSQAVTDVKLEWNDGYSDYELSHCNSIDSLSGQCEYLIYTYSTNTSANGNRSECPAIDSGSYSSSQESVDCSDGQCGIVLSSLDSNSKYCYAVEAVADDGSKGTATLPETSLTYPTYMYDNFEGDVLYDAVTGTGNWTSTTFDGTDTTFFQVWSSSTVNASYSGQSWIAAWNSDTQNYDNSQDSVFITAQPLDLSATSNPALVLAHQLNRPDLDFENIALWVSTDPTANDCMTGSWNSQTPIFNDNGDLNPSLDTTDWTYLYLDFSQFAGNSNICFGLAQRTNAAEVDTGFIFDNVQLVEQPDFTKTLFYEPFPGDGSECFDQNTWTELGTWVTSCDPDGIPGSGDETDNCTTWWRVIPGDDGDLDCKMWITNPTFSIGNYLDGWVYDDGALQITYPYPSGSSTGSNGYFVSEGGWTRLLFNELYETPQPSTFGIVVRWSDSQIDDCYAGGNVYMHSTSGGDTFASGEGSSQRVIDLSPFRGKYVCFIFWGEDDQTLDDDGNFDGVIGAGWQIDEVIVDTK